MASPETVQFYLEEPLRQSAIEGRHNFINQLVAVLEREGFVISFDPTPTLDSSIAARSITHMAHPQNERGLMFRRAYHYPFWQIDAIGQRWHWDVARAAFHPDEIDPDAARFYRFWQKRLFGAAAKNARHEGFVYVALQGKLDEHRAFQRCSPLEMVEHCLAHNPTRRVIAGLHPNENYSTAEMEKLNALARQHGQLSVDTGNSERYLQGCDYVATQNSGVAFNGYFFGKPTLLFGKIDFHHIAVKADMDALADSFVDVETSRPAYDKYIWWFWQHSAINAGREDVQAKITARLRRFGWLND